MLLNYLTKFDCDTTQGAKGTIESVTSKVQ